jgi:hypothetical protein
MLKFLKNIFQLILSPGNGWEDISHDGEDPKVLAAKGLYPIIGFASIMAFAQFFYNEELSLVILLQRAIIIFVQFFVTYFIASLVFASSLRFWVEGTPNEKKYSTVIIYSIAILSLINAVQSCLPVELSLVYFLYLYVAIVIWKAARYLAVKEKFVSYYVVMAIVSILVPPFLIGSLFSLIIG